MRNRQVHWESESPPSLEVCRELAEFVWYYLKTTDRLAQQAASELKIGFWTSPQSLSCLTVKFEPGARDLRVHGKVSSSLFLAAPASDCLVVSVQPSSVTEDHGYREFRGQLTGTVAALDHVIRLFFHESSI